MPYTPERGKVQFSARGGDIRINAPNRGALLSSDSERSIAHTLSSMRGTLDDCKRTCDSIPSCIGFGRDAGDANNPGLECWMKGQLNNVIPWSTYDLWRKDDSTLIVPPGTPVTPLTRDVQEPNAPMTGFPLPGLPLPGLPLPGLPLPGLPLPGLPLPGLPLPGIPMMDVPLNVPPVNSTTTYSSTPQAPTPQPSTPQPSSTQPSTPQVPTPTATGSPQSIETEAANMFNQVLSPLSPSFWVPDLSESLQRALYYAIAERGRRVDMANLPSFPEVGESDALADVVREEMSAELRRMALSANSETRSIDSASAETDMYVMAGILTILSEVIERVTANQNQRTANRPMTIQNQTTPQTASGGGLLANPVQNTPDAQRTSATLAAQVQPPTQNNETKKVLSAGAIAGIVIGSIVLVLVIIVAIIYWKKRKALERYNKV